MSGRNLLLPLGGHTWGVSLRLEGLLVCCCEVISECKIESLQCCVSRRDVPQVRPHYQRCVNSLFLFGHTTVRLEMCSLQFERRKGLFQRKGYGNAARAAKEIKHLLAGCHSVHFAQTCQTPYVCVIVDDKRAALIENKVAGSCGDP